MKRGWYIAREWFSDDLVTRAESALDAAKKLADDIADSGEHALPISQPIEGSVHICVEGPFDDEDEVDSDLADEPGHPAEHDSFLFVFVKKGENIQDE